MSRIAKRTSKLRALVWFNIWAREVGKRTGREARAVAARIFRRFQSQGAAVHAKAVLRWWQKWRQRRVQLFRIGSAVMKHQIHIHLCHGFLFWKNATQGALREQIIEFQRNSQLPLLPASLPKPLLSASLHHPLLPASLHHPLLPASLHHPLLWTSLHTHSLD